MKPKVLIPLGLQRYERLGEILEPLADVEYVERANRERYDELLPTLEAMVSGRINEETLQGAPKLRVVAKYAVGYDDCDVEAMIRHKVYLCHTPGVLSGAVADMALALLFRYSRTGIVVAYLFAYRWGWGITEQLSNGAHFAYMCFGVTVGILSVLGMFADTRE